MHPLAVSRLSIVNSLGAGLPATARALREGRSGLAPCAFETVALQTYTGEISGLDEIRLPASLSVFDCRNNRLAQWGLESDGFTDAVAEARQQYGPARIGVFMGTSTSGILQTELAYRRRDPHTGALPAGFHYGQTQNSFSVADFVRRYLDLHGPVLTISSACSSTAKVFGNAARMMAAGVCDAAIVGGVDTLCLTTLYGFNSLGLVSRSPCRPYDVDRDGISIGEGAGFALLEKPSAKYRKPAAMLLGVGESCDAYHMSTPHPDGLGAKLAMRRALASAGLNPGDIDYINLHGTATKSNDASEDKAVFEIFAATPCSSTKGWTGHLLGAAGITEAIISILAMEEELLPGSLHTQTVDPLLQSNYLIDGRRARIERVLSNSFGFGGSNCSLILESADARLR